MSSTAANLRRGINIKEALADSKRKYLSKKAANGSSERKTLSVEEAVAGLEAAGVAEKIAAFDYQLHSTNKLYCTVLY